MSEAPSSDAAASSPCVLAQQRLLREKQLRETSSSSGNSQHVPSSNGCSRQRPTTQQGRRFSEEAQKVASMGVRASQAHAEKTLKELFSLRLKFHLEEEKSKKVEESYARLEKAHSQCENDLQSKCKEISELRQTNLVLHEALEKQDVVLEDALLINDSYQQRYEELQSKAERFREFISQPALYSENHLIDNMKELGLSFDESFVSGNNIGPPQDNPEQSVLSPISISERIAPQTHDGSIVYKSTLNGSFRESMSPSRSSFYDRPPSPSYSDRVSIYNFGGRKVGESEDLAPSCVDSQRYRNWTPSKSVNEISYRISKIEGSFNKAKEKLDVVSSTIEDSFQPPAATTSAQGCRPLVQSTVENIHDQKADGNDAQSWIDGAAGVPLAYFTRLMPKICVDDLEVRSDDSFEHINTLHADPNTAGHRQSVTGSWLNIQKPTAPAEISGYEANHRVGLLSSTAEFNGDTSTAKEGFQLPRGNQNPPYRRLLGGLLKSIYDKMPYINPR